MLVATDYHSLDNIKDNNPLKIIALTYLKELFEMYNINTIEEIGKIILIENPEEINSIKDFGLSEPISADNIEFSNIIHIKTNTQDSKYYLGCFLIDNDFAIYVVISENLASENLKAIFENCDFKTIKNLEV